MEALDRVSFDPSNDKLWVVGDMVNRGSGSLETLHFLYQHRSSIRCVLGNHDLHLLAVHFGQRKLTASDTLDEILNADDINLWVDWLRQQPLCLHYSKTNFTMVHAGIAPQWNLQDALIYSAEIEAVLQSDNIGEFLATMYGNEPLIWDNKLVGNARLRCITNYFTRMRICNRQGQLDLNYKGGLEHIPEGYMAWFDHPNRKTQNERIVFGHWAALEGQLSSRNIFGLDTACVWGRSLTLMRMEKLSFTTVDAISEPTP